jgi:hypothetical protein
MLNRKQLPNFGVLSHLKFDINEINEHCRINNLLNVENYVDININTTKSHSKLLLALKNHVDTFFLEGGADSLQGEKYRQLYLTEFDESKSNGEIKSTEKSIYSRTKRLNKNSTLYTPEADELNYGIRNSLVTGILTNILNSFTSKVTRVRFAYLAPNYSIKPHVDYDPSYICRYHIPLITNKDCMIGSYNGNYITKTHFPADGRVYFLNTGKKHWAENFSNKPRIHLLIDVHGQDEMKYLEEFFN